MEVVRAIRRNIPEKMPIFWKISAVDWLPKGEGWELEDTLRYIPILAAEGVDLFDVSSGGTDRRQQVQLGQQYQVPFAKAVKELKLPNVFVAAVGWIRDADTVHDVCCSLVYRFICSMADWLYTIDLEQWKSRCRARRTRVSAGSQLCPTGCTRHRDRSHLD